MQIICRGSKLWQLSASNTFKCLLRTENSMTGRAYMGEVLIHVWLKSITKWVSYLTNKWMHKKRKTSRVHASFRKPTKRVCDENERKNDGHLKYFWWKGAVYKVIAEHSCNGYQMTPVQRFLIHWRYYLFSKRLNRCQGDGFSSVGAWTAP